MSFNAQAFLDFNSYGYNQVIPASAESDTPPAAETNK